MVVGIGMEMGMLEVSLKDSRPENREKFVGWLVGCLCAAVVLRSMVFRVASLNHSLPSTLYRQRGVSGNKWRNTPATS